MVTEVASRLTAVHWCQDEHCSWVCAKLGYRMEEGALLGLGFPLCVELSRRPSPGCSPPHEPEAAAISEISRRYISNTHKWVFI